MNNEQKHITEEPLGTATPTAPTSEPSGTPTPWPWWQRLWRWMLGIVVGVVALVLLLAVLLYIPPVQNWVAKTAASQLSATLGYTIEVGQVRIGFPLQLKLKNISAWEGEKEVARLGYLTANASLLTLLKGGVIPVSEVTLGGVVLDFTFPSDSLFLQGYLDEVAVNRLRFDTQSSLLEVDHFKASHGNVRITILTDSTTVEEPPTEPSPLVIKIKRVKIEELASQVVLPTSGTLIDARIIKGDIAGGEVNLKGAFYQAQRLEIEAWLGSVGADISFLPMPWHAKIKGKEARYGGANDIKADIEELYYKVGDGWEVQEARLKLQKDSVQMRVPLIDITLPQSHIYGKALLPFEGWIPATKGEVEVDLRGQLNPSEVDRFVGGLPGIPQELYALMVKGEGAMEKELNVELSLSNPQVLALELQAKGNKVLSKNEGTLAANYTLTTHQMAMQRASQLISQGEEATPAPRWTIPSALQLRGKAEWKKGQGSTDFFLTSPQGHLLGYLQYHPKRKAYKGTLDVRELNLQQFLPADSLATLSATVQLEGRGTDPMNPATEASLYAQIDSIQYKHTTLNQLMLLSRLSKSNLFGALDLGDEALKLTAQVDAHLAKADVQGSVNLFLDTIIPSQLGLNIPIIEGAKLELRGHLRSDLKEFYDFDGELENFWIQTDRNTIQPTNTYVVASTSDSLMYGEVTSGDLSLMVDIENGLNDFINRIKKLTQEVKASFADSLGTLDMAPWMQYYPTMKVDLSMGRNNLLRAYLDEHRIGARSARLSLRTTTAEGLSGEGVVSYFQMDTFRIDNMDLVLRQDPSFFYGFASVHKERFHNQLPFTIVSSITTNVQRSELYLHWTDHHGDDFVQLGLEMWNQPSGDITLGFTPDPLILLHNQFEVLGEEVITLPKENRTNIRTNMELRSTSGATITLHDAPHPQGNLLQAELKDLRLSRLSGISFIPNLRGVVEANASWLQHHHKGNQDYHLSAEVLNGYFNDVPVGDLKLQATVEERKAEGTYLTADANIDGVPVAELTSYQATGEEKRNRRLWLRAKELPLDKANPFLPSHYLNISGTVNAELANYNTKANIRQATTQKMQGQITFKGAEVFVPLANEHYRLDEHPLYIKEDNLILDNFRLTSNNSHLTSNGTVALGLPEYPLNIRLQGNDILLLNSSQTDDTQLFGTVQADANIRVTGPIRAFKLQGDVAIKGNTNVTFQDKEAELRQRNNLRGLVEFTDFTDTLFVAKTKAIDSLSLSGNDIRLNLHIDPAARVGFTFNNASTQLQASIQGGGDFNLKIPPYGAMNLSGTYSLSDGDVQVNLTVPPIAQRFNINQGSRIIWNGALLDPNIDFSATSKIRSQITQADGPSRSVEFNVTLFIENQLDNLALRFHTSAPSDLALQNELATLSPEEQNRQSIMLLATKQYFGPGSGAGGQKGFDMSSTLTSMLASQFNSLAGDALNAEINLGIANTTNAYGTGTDYTYSIAKRFYNDRITLQVGGRMMTGQAATGMQQSFIDNMSLSYRLDQAGTHYLRLFHRRNFENLLDGEVIETGVGYLIRRRLNRLSQLFNFRKPKANPLSTLTPTTPPSTPHAPTTTAQ